MVVSLPNRLFKFVALDVGLIILAGKTRRWSSPLCWEDQEDFRRIPRFSPSLSEAMAVLPAAILDIASGRTACDEQALTTNAAFLVRAARMMLKAGSTQQQIIKLWSAATSEPDEMMSRGLQDFFTEQDLAATRVFCVTDDIGNKHLWSDYADAGRGCVLEFQHVKAVDSPLVLAEPVHYSPDGPVLGGALKYLLFGGSYDLKRDIMAGISLSKGVRWQAEREWRVVTHERHCDGELYSDYSFHSSELASVTLGPNFDLRHVDRVRGVLRAQYPETRLLRMPASYDASARMELAIEFDQ